MIKDSYGVLKINQEGGIIFDDVNLKDVIQKYEPPFFLISENQLADNYKNFVKSFSALPDFGVFYSVKTNFESGILKTLNKLGCGAEISGGQDFLVAKKAGFPAHKIIFDGPCKNKDEIVDAIKSNIHCLNIESMQEMKEIEQIASSLNMKINVGIRIDPLVDKNYYDVIIDTYKRKFGFPINEVEAVFRSVKQFPHLNLIGIHMHIGSHLTRTSLYTNAIDKVFELMFRLKKHGIEIQELNMGGGYPAQSIRTIKLSRRLIVAQVLEKIGFNLEKKVPSIYEFGEAISKAYYRNSKKYDITPRILTEPGRSIVSDVAVLVGKVRVIKKNWVFVDFGVNDLAENMFFAERDFGVPGKMNQDLVQKINISGPTLSTADVIYLNVDVPKLEIGDPIAIFDVGAYSIPRSNQFTQPRKAIYFKQKEDPIKLIRSRETYEDVIKNQIW